MLARFSKAIVNSIFPPVCVHCRREGDWLCPAARALIEAEPPLMDRISVPGIDHIVLRGSYDNTVIQAIIQKIKYHYWTGLRDILPVLLSPLVPHLASTGDATVVLPVPLHPRRYRERGFNQSAILAHALAGLTGLPVQDLLYRQRHTTPQAHLKEAQRLTNLTGAFGLRPHIEKIPRSAILVDDVLTTGATFRECATVLRASGVQDITAVALAKG